MNKKLILTGIGVFVVLIFLLVANPVGWNNSGNRVVITPASGPQSVVYKTGIYWSGFFSQTQEWPNRIILSYQNPEASALKPDIDENTVEIGPITGMFMDGPTAGFYGVAQFNLPNDEAEMIEIHQDHKNPTNLISARLSTYLSEALNSSCQLMNSETHYSGGRAQMSQDYLEQMRSGVYIVKTKQDFEYDSLEKTSKRTYTNAIMLDKNNLAIRKSSSIKAYGITVSDASIANVVYSPQITERLKKKVDAATDASISKQQLMTAEQKRLTAKAQGEQKLTEIEYQQKQEQTKQVVQAETQVMLAEQDRQRQSILLKGSILEAQKIKTLADAEAYAKQRTIQANGALEQKLEAYVQVQQYWAEAFSKYSGNVVPMYSSGGGTPNNGGINFMEIMGAKAARDLSLDIDTRK